MNTNDIFEKVARQYNTTADEVYEEIQKAIDAGFDNPDPDVQNEWKKMNIQGKRPTPEEVIEYLVKQMKNSSNF